MFQEHELNCISQENPLNPFQDNLGMFHQGNTNTLEAYHLNRLLASLQADESPILVPHYSSSCLSNNSSTSDEAEDDHQMRAVDERKRRRMISNRESARRSRMRKQRHLDELQTQIARLVKENHKLVDKLNHVTQCLDKVVLENATLKEETSDLRQMVSELRIGSPFDVVDASSAFRDLDEGSRKLFSGVINDGESRGQVGGEAITKTIAGGGAAGRQ